MGRIACCLAFLALGPSTSLADVPPRHWSYEGSESPEHWGELAKTCSTGTRQSPVFLSTRGAITRGTHAKLDIGWGKVSGEAVDNGHTIQVSVPPGNFLTYGKQRYELQQLHFHVPSEHSIDGEHSAMEVHFVHKNAEGQLAVLALMLRSGQANAVLGPLFAALPPPGGAASRVEVNLPAMLPKNRAHFSYEGSLTTPPCTEGVQWIVLLTQPSVSRSQLDRFRVRYAANARPTQAWRGRKIELIQ
jgi:carbonic anhydrase